jgi:hypothetical protein
VLTESFHGVGDAVEADMAVDGVGHGEEVLVGGVEGAAMEDDDDDEEEDESDDNIRGGEMSE